MARIEYADALYPELQMAVMRDEIRRAQQQQESVDAARRCRRERWAAWWARLRVQPNWSPQSNPVHAKSGSSSVTMHPPS